jgi:hypothetical protein
MPGGEAEGAVLLPSRVGPNSMDVVEGAVVDG